MNSPSLDDDRIIVVDKAQQDGKHDRKHRDMSVRGYKLFLAPLPVGDYILATDRVKDAIRRKYERRIAIKKLDLLGTYTTAVDTKRDMFEVYNNIVGKQHARFRDECILAQNNGIRLVVLVENTDGIKDIHGVAGWKNERFFRWHRVAGLHKAGKALATHISDKPPMSSPALMKAMITMELKYGVEFQFCKPTEAGRRIIEILEGSGDG